MNTHQDIQQEKAQYKIHSLQVVGIAFVVIYLITSIISLYLSRGILSLLPPMPTGIYGIKWGIAIALILCLLNISKKKYSTSLWLVINTLAICVLVFKFFTFGMFYMADIEMFSLELVSLGLIIGSNGSNFVQKVNIRRKAIHYILILVIAALVGGAIYHFFGLWGSY